MTSSDSPSVGERLASAATLVLLLAAALWLLLGPGHIQTDLATFLPPPDATAEADLPANLLLGDSASRETILAAIEGSEAGERAATSRALAAELTGHPDIRRVLNGERTAQTEVPERLFAHRYLLSPLLDANELSESTLRDELTRRRDELSSPASGASRQWLAEDPVCAWHRLLDQWAGSRSLPRPHGVWTSPDGDRALLVIELESGGLDPEAQSATLASIRAGFRAVEADGGGQELLLTGPAVFAADSARLIQGEITRLSLVAGILVAGLLLLAFRSVRHLLLAGLPLGAAILGGSALVMALFGGLHGITLAFGVILVGVALDYPLHLFMHRGAGLSPWPSARRLWPTLALGAVTTTLGFGAMALVGVSGLAQLGVFAVGGLLPALLTTRFLLPWHLPPSSVPATPGRFRLRGLAITPRRRIGLLAVLAGGGVLLLSLQGDRVWQNDLSALNPVPAETRAADARLRADLGTGSLRHLALVRGHDAQQVLERSEALAEALTDQEAAGVLEGVDHPARWLPSAKRQRERRARLPTAAALEERLPPIAAEVGFRPDAFDPFIEAVANSHRLKPLKPGDPELGWIQHQLAPSLFREEGEWFGLVRFRAVHDAEALARWFRETEPAGARYLDTTTLAAESLAEFRQQALFLFTLGVALMLALLSAVLGSWRAGVETVLVPLTSALLAATLLVTLGQPLSLFHLVSLLLVVGLGLDYALFARRHGGRDDEVAPTRRALLLCLASTMAVFGALALSELTVLADIGRTVVPGALVAWLLARLGVMPDNAGSGQADTQHRQDPLRSHD